MKKICSLQLAIAALVFPGVSLGQTEIRLDNYQCREFLSDAKAPKNAAKLLRSMMLVSWATGYAAAHQTTQIRSDPRALQIVSGLLGDVCAKSPDAVATRAVADAIDKYTTDKLSGSK